MKIRSGFVSNSSSSSFLVFFPHEIKSEEETYTALWSNNDSVKNDIKRSYKFSDSEGVQNFNSYYNSLNMTFDEFLNSAAKTVWKDIEEQGPNNLLSAIVTLEGNGTYNDNKLQFWSFPESDEFKGEYSSIEELKEDLEKYKSYVDKKYNFDWENGTDEEYDKLERFVDDYSWIFGDIIEKIDEIEKYIKKHKNYVFYTFRYADEDGTYFSILEHECIFSKYPYYVESHH